MGLRVTTVISVHFYEGGEKQHGGMNFDFLLKPRSVKVFAKTVNTFELHVKRTILISFCG